MSTLSPVVIATIHRQVGHITAQQLAAAGVSRSSRQRLVDKKVFTHVYKSVYRLVDGAPTFEQRLVALSLAHPSGYVTGPTLGGYLGVRKMPKSSKINLCLPHGSPFAASTEIRIRQSTKIESADRRRLENGMMVASWPRLVFDLAADLSPRSFVSVVEQVLDLHCTVQELAEVGRRLCHPGRPGSLLFMETLLRRGGRAAVQSDAELLVLEGLLARGIPVVPQHSDLRLPGGGTVRVDLAVPTVRWGVEVDVHPSHFRLSGVTRDQRRDRKVHLVDWQLEHVTELDLLDLEPVLDELALLYRTRVERFAQ